MVLAQAVLGGLTVIFKLPRFITLSHLTLSMCFFSVTIVLAIRTRTPDAETPPIAVAASAPEPRLLAAADGARDPRPDPPRRARAPLDGGPRLHDVPVLLRPRLAARQPERDERAHPHAPPDSARCRRRRRDGDRRGSSPRAPRSSTGAEARSLRRLAIAAPILVLVQITLGVLSVTTLLHLPVVEAHLGVGALLLGELRRDRGRSCRRRRAAPASATDARRGERRDVAPSTSLRGGSSRSRPAHAVAARSASSPTSSPSPSRGSPRWSSSPSSAASRSRSTRAATRRAVSSAALVASVVGTALVVAGANALNMYLERDTDALMERTQEPPAARGPPRARGRARRSACARVARSRSRSSPSAVNAITGLARGARARQLRARLHAAQAADARSRSSSARCPARSRRSSAGRR